MRRYSALILITLYTTTAISQICPSDPRCLNNPSGAGNPYLPNGLNNPNSPYRSPYDNKSINNPIATDAPKIYDQYGNYRGKLSTNPNDPDSISNKSGRYGDKNSPDSIKNPYGAGNPYNGPLTVVPQNTNVPMQVPEPIEYEPTVGNFPSAQQTAGAALVILGAVVLGYAIKAIFEAIVENKNNYKEPPKQIVMTTPQKRDWGQVYLFGPADKIDYQKAKLLLTEAANDGDEKAQFSLATMYRLGRGVVKDETEAFNWYIKSADQGNGTSALLVGDSYRLGKGVDRSEKSAYNYYKKAAENGEPTGMLNTGYYLMNGIGISQNLTEGFDWLKKSADKNNSWAKYHLGIAYLHGKGTTKDVAEGVKLLEVAKEMNVTPAGQILGNVYETGINNEQNIEKAVALYRWAAERKDKTASYRLAYLHEQGNGVEKNIPEAIKWYKVAGDLGVSGAKMKAMMLEKEM